jgi:hypothetical protein
VTLVSRRHGLPVIPIAPLHAMGIATGAGVHRPAPRPLRCLRAHTRRPMSSRGWPSFRLLFEPELAGAVPRRGIQHEAVNPSGLGPACRGEAGSRRDARKSDRGLYAPQRPAIHIAPLQVLVLFVFDPPRMQRRLTPSLPTRLYSAMSPISLGGPAPVFQTQAKVARSLAVSETSTDGVVDPWWSYARLIRSD